MPSTTGDRLYDVIYERKMSDEGGVPSAETLAEVSSALGAIDEFLTGPIARSLIKIVNDHEAERLTDEQVGRLVIWADHMRELVSYIDAHLDRVAIAARESWSEEGVQCLSDYGIVLDDEAYKRLKRRLSFNA